LFKKALNAAPFSDGDSFFVITSKSYKGKDHVQTQVTDLLPKARDENTPSDEGDPTTVRASVSAVAAVVESYGKGGKAHEKWRIERGCVGERYDVD